MAYRTRRSHTFEQQSGKSAVRVGEVFVVGSGTGVGAHRGEEAIAALARSLDRTDERCIDQVPKQGGDIGFADRAANRNRLSRVEIKPAGEHAQATEDGSGGGRQQVQAPVEQALEASLAIRQGRVV